MEASDGKDGVVVGGNSGTARSPAAKATRLKRPSRIWESGSSSPSPPQSEPATPRHQSSTFRFFSEDTLHALHSLPCEESILLLTPVVPHPPDSDLHGQNVDPFEPFGHALSKHHARIRHVPYIPDLGLTKTLSMFLEHADAVIVVWCEPTSTLKTQEQLHGSGSKTLASQSFMGQMRFLKAVRKAMYPSRFRAEEKVRRPLIVVTSGPPGSLLDQNIGIHDYDTVIYCPYHTQALKNLAEILFDSDWINHQAIVGTASGDVSRLSLAAQKMPSKSHGGKSL